MREEKESKRERERERDVLKVHDHENQYYTVTCTLFSSSRPLDKQVVKVAREGGVVQSRVGGAKERENKGEYSARSNT